MPTLRAPKGHGRTLIGRVGERIGVDQGDRPVRHHQVKVVALAGAERQPHGAELLWLVQIVPVEGDHPKRRADERPAGGGSRLYIHDPARTRSPAGRRAGVRPGRPLTSTILVHAGNGGWQRGSHQRGSVHSWSTTV